MLSWLSRRSSKAFCCKPECQCVDCCRYCQYLTRFSRLRYSFVNFRRLREPNSDQDIDFVLPKHEQGAGHSKITFTAILENLY